MLALVHENIVNRLYSNREPWMDIFDVRDVSNVQGIEVGWLAKEDGTYSVPDTVAAPVVIPEVSSAQAKIMLSRASFLAPAKEHIAAIGGEVEIWFSDARTWQRNNPHVVEIGASLGLSSAEIDDLFREAAKIDA